ncbi:MAG: alpha-amylase family protein [Anaerolinea sp.]|nr:alpha-amylase family protein [Anaerolinea sp.]
MTYWYDDVIVYGIDVKVFCDSNGDGFGDFRGLTGKLDYLTDLGIDCVWLLPFYPSPLRDNGYDVTDYCDVDPRLGTLDDFKAFMAAAKEHGIRVLIDLVANHTSSDHAWFQAARQDRESPYRDYYVWVDEPPPNTGKTPVFPGVEDSNWTYDAAADAHYWHYFYRHQPGLNHRNPKVREEFRKVMAFWLQLGVDGFRIDAAPMMIADKGTEDPFSQSRHAIVREMRAYAETINPEVVLLAEANTEPERLDEFFGSRTDADEMNMLFNFLLNVYIFLVLARGEAEQLHEFLRILPHTPENGQWLNFLRNHDELDLSRLTEAEREDVLAAFAPDPAMRAYDRGIRRRLAPMLNGDRRRMELAFSLLFSTPGTPLLMWGDEIGMGDDLSLEERESVRTPMQWSRDSNGGFSSAPAAKLFRPVIDKGDFGYQRVNVAAQQSDSQSFWHWMRRLMRCTHQLPELNHGEIDLIRADDSSVLVHASTWEGKTTITIHNLSAEPCRVHCHFEGYDLSQFEDVFDDQPYERVEGSVIELHGYGYRWLRSPAPQSD